jgi:hypothetical protein
MKKFFGITNEELHLKINMFSNILYTCTRGRETCRMEILFTWSRGGGIERNQKGTF